MPRERQSIEWHVLFRMPKSMSRMTSWLLAGQTECNSNRLKRREFITLLGGAAARRRGSLTSVLLCLLAFAGIANAQQAEPDRPIEPGGPSTGTPSIPAETSKGRVARV
jgi:hypothetical protein